MTALNFILLPLLLAGATAPHPFVPGEALVRFMPGSEGAAALEAALRASPPDIALLAPVVSSMDTRTRVPLAVARAGGGRDILIRVDAERLSEQTAAGLRRGEGVAAVATIPAPSPPAITGGVRTPAFVVEFQAGSPQAACISKSGETPPIDERCDPVAGLSQQIGIPLIGRVHGERRRLIEIDMPELTRLLVERLNALGDVEAAQPNFVLGIRPTL